MITETPTFGSPKPNTHYADRAAAYVVVTSDDGKVAMVSFQGKYFLPGGGCLPNEMLEDTIAREVNEELARGVRLIRRIGEAVQYFHSSSDERYYKMRATFFVGELTKRSLVSKGEHELSWLAANEAEDSYFHACHVWAIHHE